MCCIGLLALLLSLTIPALTQHHERALVHARMQDLQEAMQLARLLSEVDGSEYRLSPLAGKTDWSLGMRLLKMPQQVLVSMWQWKADGVLVSWHGFDSAPWVILSASLMHAHSNGHFLIHSAHLAQKLMVNRLGHVSQPCC